MVGSRRTSCRARRKHRQDDCTGPFEVIACSTDKPRASRLSGILRENVPTIVARISEKTKSHPGVGDLLLSDGQLSDLIQALAAHLDSREIVPVPENILRAVAMGGAAKRSNGIHCVVQCSSNSEVMTLMEHLGVVERVIFDIVQENLSSTNLSYLMSDLKRINEILHCQLRQTIRAFLAPEELAA